MKTYNNLEDLSQVANEVDRNENILEPFDPAYLSHEEYEVPDISSTEKKFLRKLSILCNKLHRAGIKFEYLANRECLRVKKFIGDNTYPTYRYLRVNLDENDYSFGTLEEDLVYDGKVSVVVEAAKKWLESKLLCKN